MEKLRANVSDKSKKSRKSTKTCNLYSGQNSNQCNILDATNIDTKCDGNSMVTLKGGTKAWNSG